MTNPVAVGEKPCRGVNGVFVSVVSIFSTSNFPDTREIPVIPKVFCDIPNTVPRTAATAESVWIEKSLAESVSVLRCGASVQTSPRERRSCTFDARLLSSLYLREVRARIV